MDFFTMCNFYIRPVLCFSSVCKHLNFMNVLNLLGGLYMLNIQVVLFYEKIVEMYEMQFYSALFF